MAPRSISFDGVKMAEADVSSVKTRKRKRCDDDDDVDDIEPGEISSACAPKRMKFDDDDSTVVTATGALNPSPAQILQTLTTQFPNCGFSLERLETIGDSFLKLATSVYAYCTINSHEGKLSEFRKNQVCNKNLHELGQKLLLPYIILNEKFLPRENWLPPNYCVDDPRMEHSIVTMSQKDAANAANVPDARLWQNVSDKSIADAVEAMIGTYLVTNGMQGALKVMKWIGIQVPHSGCNSATHRRCFDIDVPSPLLVDVSNCDEILDKLLTDYDAFEQRINYKFRNRYYLLQAMSHASFISNPLTTCYQRLEFLGDAVIGMCIVHSSFTNIFLKIKQ